MTTPKKQHFVPQFYLRNFALDDEKEFISSYHHKSEKFIIDVPIKSQAYKNYIYGKDGLVEKDLSHFEAKVANLISEPLKKINPPGTIEEFNLLKEFILIQHSRTAKAGAEAMAAINAGYQAIRPYLKKEDQLPSEFHISHEYPSLISLYHALDHSYLMNHLMMKSIVNMTDLAFITSDTPVVTYNQWMEQQG
jgi:hypothetical protein